MAGQGERIRVNPGHKLALQKHFHRAELPAVVNGAAEVRLDGETRLLAANQPRQGAAEPRRGAVDPYLGEDDIVRFEDVDART